jgi:opacity protein-like surface antigen
LSGSAVRCRILAIFTTLLLCPAAASADWLVSPFVGLRFGADTTLLFAPGPPEGSRFVWGVSGGLVTDGVFGFEGEFSYAPDFFETELHVLADSRVVTLSGNVMLALPLEATTYGLRPYVIGGLGLMHAGSSPLPDFGEVFEIDSNFLALNLGAGAIGPVSPRSSIRFDIRYFRNMKTDEAAPVMPEAGGAQLSFWRATVGLTFRIPS